MSQGMTGDSALEGEEQPPGIDVTIAHNARVWNYWLGGKDHFEVDRAAGDQVRAMHPGIVEVARADRAFLGRVVRFLVGEAGIRQFLDIGTGLPTAENTHQVAQSVAPAVRVVYVDNDPIVLAHARALLTTAPPAVASYVDADVHDPDAILRAAAKTLDFGEPVAVMMLGILNFVLDNAEAKTIVGRLLDAVVPGSYLALSHPTMELGGEGNTEAMRFWNEHARPPIRARSAEEISQFLTGLDLVPPGLVSCALWHPDAPAASVPHYGVVAVKPGKLPGRRPGCAPSNATAGAPSSRTPPPRGPQACPPPPWPPAAPTWSCPRLTFAPPRSPHWPWHRHRRPVPGPPAAMGRHRRPTSPAGRTRPCMHGRIRERRCYPVPRPPTT